MPLLPAEPRSAPTGAVCAGSREHGAAAHCQRVGRAGCSLLTWGVISTLLWRGWGEDGVSFFPSETRLCNRKGVRESTARLSFLGETQGTLRSISGS